MRGKKSRDNSHKVPFGTVLFCDFSSAQRVMIIFGISCVLNACAETGAQYERAPHSARSANSLSDAGMALGEPLQPPFAMNAPRTLPMADEETSPAAGSDALNSPPPAGEATDGLSAQDATEIMIKTSNPLGGDFMLLYNQWEVDYLKSDLDDKNLPIPIGKIGTREVISHAFQPVFPFSMEETIGEDWVFVVRPTLPIVYSADVPSGFTPRHQPGSPDFGIDIDFDKRSGLGDAEVFSLVGVSKPAESAILGDGQAVLAGGASMVFPSGTNGFSSNVWAAGPAATAAYVGEKAILGALVQTQFDFASSGNSRDYDVMTLQPFYFLNFENGWQVGGMPMMRFDFNTNENQIPIALGVGKLALIDVGGPLALPVRFGLEGRYHVARNDALGSEYTIVFSVTPVLPNIFQNLVRGCPVLSVGKC